MPSLINDDGNDVVVIVVQYTFSIDSSLSVLMLGIQRIKIHSYNSKRNLKLSLKIMIFLLQSVHLFRHLDDGALQSPRLDFDWTSPGLPRSYTHCKYVVNEIESIFNSFIKKIIITSSSSS